MKIYLFFLLVGFALSALGCIRYNLDRLKVSRIGNSCSCPHGTKKSVPPGSDKCYCYYQTQIDNCKADSRCAFDIDMGCYSK